MNADDSGTLEGRTADPDPRRWTALGVLALVQFMLVLDTTVVNVALPSIQIDLGFSPSGLPWVVNAYSLTAGGFLLLGGRIADLLGRRRLFLVGVGLFALASAAGGFAQNPATLVTARFVQGLGEAIAAPAALSLAVLLFTDPRERAKAIGAWGGLAGIGGTLGVVLSGLITSEANWRWIFWINLPVAAIVLLVAPRLIPADRSIHRGRVDILGAVLITSGLVLVVDGLLAAGTHGWTDTHVLLPLILGVALLAGFVISQSLLRDPLVPLRFFRNRTRVTANAATIFGGAAFLSMFFVLTLYMQDVGHYSALRTGLAYLPFGGALLMGIVVSTQVLPRIGVRFGLAAAFAIAAAGLLLLGQIGPHADYASHVLPGMLVFAFGQGIAFPALQNASLHDVGPGDAGLGSGVQNTFLQVGGSLGLSVLVTTALRHSTSRIAAGVSPLTATTDGYALALRIAAAAMLLGGLIVALLLEKVAFVPPDEQAIAIAQAEARTATKTADLVLP